MGRWWLSTCSILSQRKKNWTSNLYPHGLVFILRSTVSSKVVEWCLFSCDETQESQSYYPTKQNDGSWWVIYTNSSFSITPPNLGIKLIAFMLYLCVFYCCYHTEQWLTIIVMNIIHMPRSFVMLWWKKKALKLFFFKCFLYILYSFRGKRLNFFFNILLSQEEKKQTYQGIYKKQDRWSIPTKSGFQNLSSKAFKLRVCVWRITKTSG